MDTKFAVALHILLFIAETEKIASSEIIAKSVNTNSSHIRKITTLLKRANLIESSQGKSGFQLTKSPEEINLAEIYRAIYLEKNILNIHADPNGECPLGARIEQTLEPVFEKAQNAFLNELKSKNLADLIAELYKL